MGNQLSINIDDSMREYYIEEKKLKIKVFENLFTKDECDYYLKKLNDSVKWKRESITVWGKKRIMKRKIAWYGDEGKKYSYSGITVHPKKWIKDLSDIKEKIEKVTLTEFNSVLLNEYENGNVGMGWHSDDEKELGRNPVIGSVSFGAERDFFLKTKKDLGIEKIKIKLTNGSYIIMRGETQHYWMHSIPVRKKVKDRRINLTFRKII